MSQTARPTDAPDLIRPELERLLANDPNLKPLLAFHDAEVYPHSVTARGSTGAHHDWLGGYQDYVLQCFQLAEILHRSLDMWLSLSNAVTVLYLHDVPRLLRARHRTPADRFDANPAGYLEPYGVSLGQPVLNALRYVHGEVAHYRNDTRVMNSLAAFCHSVVCLSTRVYYGHKGVPVSSPVVPLTRATPATAPPAYEFGAVYGLPSPEDRKAILEALEAQRYSQKPLMYVFDHGNALPTSWPKMTGSVLSQGGVGVQAPVSLTQTSAEPLPLPPPETPVQPLPLPPVPFPVQAPVQTQAQTQVQTQVQASAVPPPAASMADRRAAALCAGADLAREILTLAGRADGRKTSTAHLGSMLRHFEEQLQAASPGVVLPGGAGL